MPTTLAVLGIVVPGVLALGAIAVTIYVYRKQSPRREFSYTVEASPLMSTQVQGLDKLKVAFAGVPLSHPYLVTLRIGSTGRADISSSSFDGGKPVLFDLKVPVLAQLNHIASSDTVGARLTFGEGDTAIALQPTLLPKGYTIRASYLCDGLPDLASRIELADITIRNQFRPPVSSSKRLEWLATVAGGATAAVVGSFGAFNLALALR